MGTDVGPIANKKKQRKRKNKKRRERRKTVLKDLRDRCLALPHDHRERRHHPSGTKGSQVHLLWMTPYLLHCLRRRENLQENKQRRSPQLVIQDPLRTKFCSNSVHNNLQLLRSLKLSPLFQLLSL